MYYIMFVKNIVFVSQHKKTDDYQFVRERGKLVIVLALAIRNLSTFGNLNWYFFENLYCMYVDHCITIVGFIFIRAKKKLIW